MERSGGIRGASAMKTAESPPLWRPFATQSRKSGFKLNSCRSRKGLLIFVLTSLLVLRIMSLWDVTLGFERPYWPRATGHAVADHEPPAYANATLGFAKLFVINLESRGDRRDDMAMIASAAGLDVTYFPGMPSAELDTQALPDSYGSGHMNMELPHMACYRGHANLWRHIVEEGLETAVIMEDDVDFDLTIRRSMPPVLDGLKRISNSSIWNNDSAWDILYLGQCYEIAYSKSEQDNLNISTPFFIDVPEDEPNVDREIFNWVEDVFQDYFNDTSPRRALVRSKNPSCTHAYAITQRAALRLLMETNNWLPFPVDISMIHYMNVGKFESYSILPPLATQWLYENDATKNSDIETLKESRHNWGLLWSARKLLANWTNQNDVQHREWWTTLDR